MSFGHHHFNKDVGMEYGTTCYTGGSLAQQSGMGSMLNQQAMGNAMLNQQAVQATVKPPEKKSMFKEITTDIKAFVLEHRGVIYFIAFALILDHVFFRGAFKSRLQGMADRLVAKVEEKIQ